MERDSDHRPRALPHRFPELGFLLVGQKADSRVVLLEELHGADRIRLSLSVRDRCSEQQ